MTIKNESGSSNEVIKPEKLYRSFTVSVSQLSPELFEGPLIPGSEADYASGLMSDGNELGVYMTTNPNMARTAYAHSAERLPCARYNSGRGIVSAIDLPRCGVNLEIDTTDLDIRPPKISTQMQHVYNNGFVGDEWIADEVPASKYSVVSLSLSTYQTDASGVLIEITPDTNLETVIERIKALYKEKQEIASRFSTFLDTLDEKSRLSEYMVRRKWEQYQKENPAV